MKKNILIAILPFIVYSIISLVACKKSDDTTTGTPINTGNSNDYYFRCKINGADWAATQPTGNDTDFFGSTAYAIINNTTANTNQFLMSVIQYDSVTWLLESSAYVSSSFDVYDDNFFMSNVQLSVTRDSINKIISGTFSFPLLNFNDEYDTLKITNGEFKVKY